MNEPLTELEQRLVAALREHLGRPELDARPAAVVADVTGRRIGRLAGMKRWVAAGVVASLVLAVVGVAVVGPRLLDQAGHGSYPSMVAVDGREYFVGVGRGLIIDPATLIPAGEAGPTADERFFDDFFLGMPAFRLPGVDRDEALVMRHGGRFDDQVDASPYAFLWRDLRAGRPPLSDALCTYFDDEHRPAECPPPELIQVFPAAALPAPYGSDGVSRSLLPRGFTLGEPTPAEASSMTVATDAAMTVVRESFAEEQARIVGVHLAAVTLRNSRLERALVRELMYVVETTGHDTGNCFTLLPATSSDAPTFGACFYTNRSSPP